MNTSRKTTHASALVTAAEDGTSIGFTLLNASNAPVIYTNQPSPLTLTITADSTTILTPGSLVFPATSGSVFALAFGGLLQSSDVEAISNNTPNWSSKAIAFRGMELLVLTPTTNVIVGPGQNAAIELDGVMATGNVSAGQVNLSHYENGVFEIALSQAMSAIAHSASSPLTLAAVAQPSGSSPVFYASIITVESDASFQPDYSPVDSPFRLVLVQSDGPSQNTGDSTPEVLVSMVYGDAAPGYGAMTTPDEALNVTINLPSIETNWEGGGAPRTDTNSLYWRFTPIDDNLIFNSGDVLITFEVQGLNTNFAPGATTFLITVVNVPGFADTSAVLAVSKTAPLFSLSPIAADPIQVVRGNNVNLSWSGAFIDNASLSCSPPIAGVGNVHGSVGSSGDPNAFAFSATILLPRLETYTFTIAAVGSSAQQQYQITTIPGNTLYGDESESLGPGGTLVSSNGEFVLTYQGDGNLVLTSQADPQTPLWSSLTPGMPGQATMQGDGNFVIVDGSQQVVFATGTNQPNSTLVLEDTGSLNLCDQTGAVVWSARRMMARGQSLTATDPNSFLLSASGVYTVRILDGALVVLDSSGTTVWTSGTTTAATALLDTTGNFLLQDVNGNTLLSSSTGGQGGSAMVTDSGVFAVFTETMPLNQGDGTGIWSTQSFLLPGQTLQQNGSLVSANTTYVLTLGDDGNLVLSDPGQPTLSFWSSGTGGTAANTVEMQADGNLVIYSSSDPTTLLFQTNTGGNPGAILLLAGDADLIVQMPDGSNLWFARDRLNDGESLLMNQQLVSQGGGHSVALQYDGSDGVEPASWDLILDNGFYFAYETPTFQVLMQSGVLTVYDTDGNALQSWTAPGAISAVVDPDGTFGLYDANGNCVLVLLQA